MLRALVLAILCCFHAASAGSHSLRYFFTGVSGGMGFPEFTAVGLVDNVQHVHYDSVTKKMRPTQDWMERSVGPEYWEGETQKAFGTQQVFKDNIGVAMQRFNQTGGSSFSPSEL